MGILLTFSLTKIIICLDRPSLVRMRHASRKIGACVLTALIVFHSALRGQVPAPHQGHLGPEASPFVWEPFPNDPAASSTVDVPTNPPNWNDLSQTPPASSEAVVSTRSLSDAASPLPVEGENSPVLPTDVPLGPPASAPVIDETSSKCVITGEVSDATSLNPLAGVYIDAVGTGRTVETDARGRFTISGLPSGTITIEATKLGYFAEVSTVTTLEGQPAETRIGLRAKPADDATEETMLEEETIVGEYQGDSQAAFNLSLDASPNIAAGISKEQFSQAAVSDAAGAVSKISGANIVGGKYAVVRGLGDRYSNTLVNGALISSADPSKKAVQLDLFPTDLLQSVAISKTFTPDLPAEFAGGMVKVETLRLPQERIIEFEFGTKTNSNNGSTFYENPDGDRDFFGKRDDEIPLGELPDGLLSQGWTGSRAPGYIRPGRPPTPAQKEEAERQLKIAADAAEQMQAVHESGGMRPNLRSPEEEMSFALTLGDRYKFDNGIEVGGVVAFTHESGDQVREDVQIGRGINYGSDSAPGSNGTPGSEDYVVRTQTEDQYTEYLNWGLLVGAGIKFGENHEIGFTGFQNTSTEDEVSIGRNIKTVGGNFPEYLPAAENPFGAGAYTYQAFDSINPLYRELQTLQLDGSHKFGGGERQIRLDWMMASSSALEDRPNSRTLYYSQLDFADPRIASKEGEIYTPSLGTKFTAADPFGNSPPLVESFRESLKTEEDAGNESIDLTFPIWARSEEEFLEFKVGINHFNRDREVRGRLFTYGISPTLNNILLSDSGQYGADYLDETDSQTDPDGNSKFNGWTGPQARSQSDRLTLTESTLLGRTVRNVDAGNELDARYMMMNLEIGAWGLVGGVRYEEEERYYQVLPDINPIAFVNENRIYNSEDYLLPALTLWRDFGPQDDFQITFAWSRTVARPTFYEYAPVEIQDQATGDIIVGNPDLTDTLITNYDLRFDWRASDRDTISLNLFHKDMANPIAQSFDLEKKTWVNGESGSLSGIEIEANRQLGAGFSITSNYTFIDSLLQYEQKINSAGESQLIDSTYEGQPENIFNFILGYEHDDLGLRASLVYNYTDSYLTGVPATEESPSIVRQPYHLLDFVLSKSFRAWGCDGKVTLKIGNLLDSEDIQVFAPTELIYKSYSPGRSVSISADLEF
jgi:TonB-dependent receptor